MAAEKARLGYGENDLVFLGVSNLAHYHWCPMQAVIRSRMDEVGHFLSYLHDKLACASVLGISFVGIRSDKALLEAAPPVGIARLLRLVAPRLDAAFVRTNARLEAAVAALPDPRVAGRLLQLLRGGRYPTVRWAFHWQGYILCGIPDGLTREFVYEFKTTRDEYLSKLQQPVAFAQADLYGRLFRRKAKRVQIFLRDRGQMQTWTLPIDKRHSLKTIRGFRAVDAGALPPLPSPSWKCRKCPPTIRDRCPIVLRRQG